jgi:hypothetical protein
MPSFIESIQCCGTGCCQNIRHTSIIDIFDWIRTFFAKSRLEREPYANVGQWELEYKGSSIMLSPSAPTNRKIILLAAATLVAGASIAFAQGGGVGGAGTGGGAAGGVRGGAPAPAGPPPTPAASPPVVNPSSPNTVPQSSSTSPTPSTPGTTPSTPGTASSGEVRSPANAEPPNTAARSERQASLAKKRSVHRCRAMLVPYSCGYLGCARTYAWAFPCQYYSRYCYTASARWWPGYYDYASGQFGRTGYLGRGYRVAGYHGD